MIHRSDLLIVAREFLVRELFLELHRESVPSINLAPMPPVIRRWYFNR